MRYENRPYMEFQEPDDKQQQKMELKKFGDYGLWMSVQKVEGHEDLLSEKNLKELGDEKNLYSMFHAIWTPKLYFKEQFERLCLKVNYRMTDEGRTDSLDKIMPFVIWHEVNWCQTSVRFHW